MQPNRFKGIIRRLLLKMTVSSVKRIFSVVLILHCSYIASWAKCVINVKENFNANSPLLLDQKTLDIIHPKQLTPSILTFAAGEELLIHCVGHEITRNHRNTGSEKEIARCVQGLKFFSPTEGVEYSFKDLSCSKDPEPTAWRDGRRCGRGGVIVNHGFSLSRKSFKTTVESCYVNETMTTAWSYSKIPGSIEGKLPGIRGATRFSQGPFFGRVSLDDVYLTRTQRLTFMEIFNDEKLVAYYMPQEGKERNYFARGHLAARADFFYWAEQRSTYFYVNVLPMWQSINNGNWRGVEGAVRRIASVEGDLDVWTGGLGVLELNNEEIFLAKDERDDFSLVPAPKLLFKLVYSESRNEALVFITANNPYLDEGRIPNEYKICKKYRECDDKYKLFTRIFRGYTYCCLVEGFLQSSMVDDLNLPVDFSNVQPLTLA